ncbi:hypothetical protein ACFGVR_14895 [Mucilaginibacter sp. AW1-3]
MAFIVIIGIIWFRNQQQQETQREQQQILTAARNNIYSQVKVEGSNYMVNRLFGGITDLRVTVTNNSDYLVDIVKVKVSYIKADGGLYKDEVLYFSKLAPHSVQTQDAPHSDRGIKVQINQESLSCAALQLN